MVGEETRTTERSKATILKRPGKKWTQRDAAIIGCSHKVAVRPDEETLVVEGHHSKDEMARALGFHPEKLGNNDFDCETAEIEILPRIQVLGKERR